MKVLFSKSISTNLDGMGTMEIGVIIILSLAALGLFSLITLDTSDKLDENAWAKSEKENRNAHKRKKEAEIAKAIKEKDVENAKAIKKKYELEAKEVAAKRFALKLSTLESHLPFNPSNKTLSKELVLHDNNMWDGVTQLIKNQDNQKTSLYFVKIRSLMDDREYFKIGITTKNVKTMFKKSTEIELLEEVKIFDTEKWKAAFLEYHFLREFRLYDGLSTSIGEQRPEVRFSGYTEVVRSNSVNKISEYFEELDVYNRIYLR